MSYSQEAIKAVHDAVDKAIEAWQEDGVSESELLAIADKTLDDIIQLKLIFGEELGAKLEKYDDNLVSMIVNWVRGLFKQSTEKLLAKADNKEEAGNNKLERSQVLEAKGRTERALKKVKRAKVLFTLATTLRQIAAEREA